MDVPRLTLTEREPNAVLTTQVVWLADLVLTHVPRLLVHDLADEGGRRLMQARGQCLVGAQPHGRPPSRSDPLDLPCVAPPAQPLQPVDAATFDFDIMCLD